MGTITLGTKKGKEVMGREEVVEIHDNKKGNRLLEETATDNEEQRKALREECERAPFVDGGKKPRRRTGVVKSDPSILFEEKSLCGKHEKSYRRNDGTMKSIIALGSMQNGDENGDLSEIDNSLTDNGETFETKKGKYQISLAKNTKRNSAVSMKSKDVSIEWNFLPEANVAEACAIATESEEGISGKKLGDTIVYENAAKGVNLEYEVQGENVKEKIVVREKQEAYIYRFELKLNGVTPRLSADGTSIELYRSLNDGAGNVTEEKEAEIPAPFMYDGVGARSENVTYELEQVEEGEYLFAVTADSEWINDDARVFPVVIDPQIIIGNKNNALVNIVANFSEYNASTQSWVNSSKQNYKEIVVMKTAQKTASSLLYFNIKKLNIQNYPIVIAKLIFKVTSCQQPTNVVLRNYTVASAPDKNIEMTVGSEFTFDMQDYINSETLCLSFFCKSTADDGEVHIDLSDIELEIEYITDDKVFPTEKEFELVGGAKATTNLYTGETKVSFTDIPVDDSLLGVGISHIHKLTGEECYCGENFRLNLYERFEKVTDSALDANFVYTDASGVKHGFKDTYYYLLNGVRQDLDELRKRYIDVDLDKNLSYCGHKVYKEQRTVTGLKAITQPEDFMGSELLENRADEQKELEERIKSYRSYLDKYVITDTNGVVFKELVKFIEEWGAINGFINRMKYGDRFALTVDEATNLQTLLLQEEALSNQISSLNGNINSLDLTYENLEHQVDSYRFEMNHIDPSLSDDDFKTRKNNLGDLKNDCHDQKQDITEQKKIINNTIENLRDQRWLLTEQINNLRSKNDTYLPEIINYYKEYVNLKHQLEKLKKQMPINYLTDGTIIKGFNEEGQLVAVYDRYENFVAVEYDDDGKMTRIYDGDDKQITLAYNNNKLLSSITDTRGRRTTYVYNDNKQLTQVTFANGKSLTFAYDTYGNINMVESSDLERYVLYYSSGLTYVGYENFSGEIVHGDHYDSIIMYGDEHSITYTENQTIVKDKYNNTEIYSFNDDGNLTEYYEEVGGVVTKAEKYSYTPYDRRHTESAKEKTLYKTAFSNYVYEKGDETVVTLDKFNNKPVREVTNARQISKNTTEQSITTYEYDDEHRCIQEKKVVTLTLPDKTGAYTTETHTYVTKYAYNSAGSVVRKESCVEGEEYTSGISIEETVYDEKGNKVKSFVYNSLDSSSKLYTESKYSEQGQVIADKDETGETSAEYEYVEGTNIVRSVKNANGSKFAYGRSVDDTVTAITQSTAEGEENSTQLSYTLGELTEVKSGNNVIRYRYNMLRQLMDAELNGQSNYAGWSTGRRGNAVYHNYFDANDDVFTTETDKHGHVIRLWMNDDVLIQNTYTACILQRSEDLVRGETVTYGYDTLNRLTSYTRCDNNGDSYTEETAYDDYGIITKQTKGECEYTYTYKSNAAHCLESVTTDGYSFYPQTDCLGRNKGKEIKYGEENLAAEYLYYRKVGDHATNMPSAVYFGGNVSGKYAVTENMKYEYDKSGNICKIFENGALVSRYTYDSIDRLVREDNKRLGKTTLFSYDNCGNITSKRQMCFTLKTNVEECEFTQALYSYNGDQVVLFGEETFEYDIIGNPTTYRGKAAEWERSRQLKKLDDLEFTYDGQNRRRTKGNIAFTYDSNGNLIKQSNGLEFIYDNAGVAGIKYNKKTYLYRKDAQGNIIAILDSAGRVVVRYVYDAWGNHAVLDGNGGVITSPYNIGILNPFRYRGYYYDTETGLYYLQTRYYDPELCRFMTIDSIENLDPEHINGLNLYAYCGDNPVMRVDPTGTIFFLFGLLIALVACTAVGGAVGGISAAVHGENVWKGIGNGLLVGFLFGLSAAAIATGVGVFAAGSIGASVAVGIGIGSAITLGLNLSEQLKSGGFGSLNVKSMLSSWAIGAAVGGLAGATSYAFGHITAYYGEMLGLALSSKTFLGVGIASVVSKGFLAAAGNALGGFIGGYLGGKLINYIATDSGLLNQGIPMWLSTVLRWFGK